jgi:hypothetical protein
VNECSRSIDERRLGVRHETLMKTLFEFLDSFGVADGSQVSERVKEWGDAEFEKFFETYDGLAREPS